MLTGFSMMKALASSAKTIPPFEIQANGKALSTTEIDEYLKGKPFNNGVIRCILAPKDDQKSFTFYAENKNELKTLPAVCVFLGGRNLEEELEYTYHEPSTKDKYRIKHQLAKL